MIDLENVIHEEIPDDDDECSPMIESAPMGNPKIHALGGLT
jgi:hypothetical protein